jgi:hypothetical protein
VKLAAIPQVLDMLRVLIALQILNVLTQQLLLVLQNITQAQEMDIVDCSTLKCMMIAKTHVLMDNLRQEVNRHVLIVQLAIIVLEIHNYYQLNANLEQLRALLDRLHVLHVILVSIQDMEKQYVILVLKVIIVKILRHYLKNVQEELTLLQVLHHVLLVMMAIFATLDLHHLNQQNALPVFTVPMPVQF